MIKGSHHIEETKRKMSKAHKGNQIWLGRHHTKEAKRPFYGKHHTEETKRKLSEMNRRRLRPKDEGKDNGQT